MGVREGGESVESARGSPIAYEEARKRRAEDVKSAPQAGNGQAESWKSGCHFGLRPGTGWLSITIIRFVVVRMGLAVCADTDDGQRYQVNE
jgi:hypothetical protein